MSNVEIWVTTTEMDLGRLIIYHLRSVFTRGYLSAHQHDYVVTEFLGHRPARSQTDDTKGQHLVLTFDIILISD